MSPLTATLAAVLAALLAVVIVRELRARHAKRLTPSASRILFPFIAESLSVRGLDAALRIARHEGSTLVPAYLARVPMHLPLDTALPRQCEGALPLLEAIEHRAVLAGVPVDSRIERGRTLRHALRELTTHEEFDTMVVAGVDATDAGFHPNDIGWIFEHVTGEIIVIRSGGQIGFTPLRRSRLRGRRHAQTPKR
ncbi:MAG: hypothetical protein ABSG64_09190 [Solirubrobacteraceae bacterium]|jgi:hypothetical protein